MVVTTMRCVLVRFILVHVTSLLSLYRGGGRKGGREGVDGQRRNDAAIQPTLSLSTLRGEVGHIYTAYNTSVRYM